MDGTPEASGTLVPALLEPDLAAILAAWRAAQWEGTIVLRMSGGIVTHADEHQTTSIASFAGGGSLWAEIRYGSVKVQWEDYAPQVVHVTRTTKIGTSPASH